MSDLRMPDINNVVIAGNLTRDPVFRRTTNGTPVTNFWIASNRKFKDNSGQWRENVCYVGVVAWYKLAENCAENLQKGSAILVEGELQSRSFRSDDGRNRNIVEIKARRVQFLNKRNEGIEEAVLHQDEMYQDDYYDTSDMDKDVHDSMGDESDSHLDMDISENDTEANNLDKGKFDFGYQNLEL